MIRWRYLAVLAALVSALATAGGALWLTPAKAADRTMPEFAHQTQEAWLNSAPLKASSFRGKVVLLEVYASG